MAKVKCNHPMCKGAVHYPECVVYVAALGTWNPPISESKADRNRGGHTRKGEGTTTPDQRAEISRQNGQLGGRPPSPVPYALLDALRKGKFRVRAELSGDPEVSEAAAALAAWSRERVALVAGGKIRSRLAPSVVKAASRLLDEICDPIAQKVEHGGGIDLGRALDSIAKKDEAK